jgi:hypothetical protein
MFYAPYMFGARTPTHPGHARVPFIWLQICFRYTASKTCLLNILNFSACIVLKASKPGLFADFIPLTGLISFPNMKFIGFSRLETISLSADFSRSTLCHLMIPNYMMTEVDDGNGCHFIHS